MATHHRRKDYDRRALVDHTDYLELRHGKLYAAKKLEVPLNEYGLPQREQLLRSVLGVVAAEYAWQGYYDVHHVAWPYSAYRALNTDDFESVGESYRNMGGMKIKANRDIHDLVHLITDPPAIPEEAVMTQAIVEDLFLRNLRIVLLPTRAEMTGEYIDDTLEHEREQRYLEMLERAPSDTVGYMPSLAELEGLSPQSPGN